MLFDGVLLGRASGSMGGVTASHNRGGQYLRGRAVPTNPNTSFQQTVRSAMSQLSARWVDTLTAVQRMAWDTYAASVLLPNPLGDPVNVGGIGMYIRSNVPRVQFGIGALPLVDDAPTVFDLGAFTAPGITSITASTKVAVLTFTDTDDWVGEDEAAMLIWDSDSKNPSINYFKGPYKPSGTILGASIVPPTSPANVTLIHQPVAGNRTFLKCRVSRADGRLSAIFRDYRNAI